MKKLYKVKEVAEILNVSDAAIRKWILRGEIKYHKIGRLVRFSEDDLIDFINRRTNIED